MQTRLSSLVEGRVKFIAFVRFKAFFIENLSVQGVGILRKTPPEWKRWLFLSRTARCHHVGICGPSFFQRFSRRHTACACENKARMTSYSMAVVSGSMSAFFIFYRADLNHVDALAFWS
ncbi:hypothetical protein N8613_01800 [Verrucomicrobia bacterium]|nr:hypothetical protein [Verrucomicrobiota bacterium]